MPTQNHLKAAVRALAFGVLLCALSVGSAYAISLHQAKDKGLVCEMATGYLKATGSPTDAIKALVTTVNTKRKAHYRKIATEHGVTGAQVGKLTAKKLDHRCGG